MKKKIIVSGLVFIMIFASTCMAFAANTYTSTISMSSYSTLTGQTRSYTGSTHKITIALTSREFQTANNPCNVYLDKKSILGDETINGSLLYLTTVGNTYSMTTTNVADGNYYYFFNNRQPVGDAWTSNSTTMSSK